MSKPVERRKVLNTVVALMAIALLISSLGNFYLVNKIVEISWATVMRVDPLEEK